jgi:hypothetical protein
VDFPPRDPEVTDYEIVELKVNDTIRAANNDFWIRSVTKDGNSYCGEASWLFHFWNIKFRYRFVNLNINKDKRALSGTFFPMNLGMVADLNKVKNEVNATINNINAAKEAVENIANTADEVVAQVLELDTLVAIQEKLYEFQEIYVNEKGELVGVVEGKLPDGSYQEEVLGDPDSYERTGIKDKAGNLTVVGRNHEPMSLEEFKATNGGSYLGIKKRNEEKDSDILSEKSKVDFLGATEMKYGFDDYEEKHSSIKNEYQKLDFDGEGYWVAWKSVAEFESDIANYSIKDNALTDKIHLETDLGLPMTNLKENEVRVRGGMEGDERAIYAFQTMADSTKQVVGKLNVISLRKQTPTVHIIPVNGATLPSKIELKKELDRIYKQAAVEWNVIEEKNIKLQFENGVFDHGGSGIFSTYNDDQNKVIDYFDEHRGGVNEEHYYLFFIKNAINKGTEIGGYMPMGCQFGFLYNNPKIHTVAHELGHGVFVLRHPFDEFDNLNKRDLCNLMDYGTCDHLNKYQWQLIQDPETIILKSLLEESLSEGINNEDCWKNRENWDWAENITSTSTQFPKIENKLDLEYTHQCVGNSRNFYKLRNPGSIKYVIKNYQDKKYYGYYSSMDEWIEIKLEDFADNNLAPVIEKLLIEGAIETGKLSSYVLPVEEGFILITGKNFDGEESSKGIAIGIIALDLAGGKVFKWIKGLKKLKELKQGVIDGIKLASGKVVKKSINLTGELKNIVEKGIEISVNKSEKVFLYTLKSGKSAFKLSKELIGKIPAGAKFIDKTNEIGYRWVQNSTQIKQVLIQKISDSKFVLVCNDGIKTSKVALKNSYNFLFDKNKVEKIKLRFKEVFFSKNIPDLGLPREIAQAIMVESAAQVIINMMKDPYLSLDDAIANINNELVRKAIIKAMINDNEFNSYFDCMSSILINMRQDKDKKETIRQCMFKIISNFIMPRMEKLNYNILDKTNIEKVLKLIGLNNKDIVKLVSAIKYEQLKKIWDEKTK